MIDALLLSVFAACVAVLGWKIHQSFAWHHRGVGERKAHAEYARIRREFPDCAEARLAEHEFVRRYVSLKPGMAFYVIGALLLVLIGLPAAWALRAMDLLH